MTTNIEVGLALTTLAIDYNRGHCAVSLCEGSGVNNTVTKPTRPEVEEPPKVPPPPPKEPPEPPEEPPEWPPEPPEPPEEPPEPEKRPRIKEPGAPPAPAKLHQKYTERALRSALKTCGVAVCPQEVGSRDGTVSFPVAAKVKELRNRPFMRQCKLGPEKMLLV